MIRRAAGGASQDSSRKLAYRFAGAKRDTNTQQMDHQARYYLNLKLIWAVVIAVRPRSSKLLKKNDVVVNNWASAPS